MKKYLTAVCGIALCAAAHAVSFSMVLMQRNANDDGNVTRTQTVPTQLSLWSYDPSTQLPGYVTLGSGLAVSGGVLSATGAAQVNADWTASSGVAQILNKPTLATVATSGAYADLSGLPTIPVVNTPSQAAASRTLLSVFQVSATRNAWVTYSVQLTVTATISGGQNGDVVLEIAQDVGFTTGVQTLAITGLGQTYSLAVALQGVQPQTGVVSGWVPAGYFVRLRTVSNTGAPSFTYRAGQEVLL